MRTSVKTCFKCNVTKPLDEFYKHSMMADGHLNKCKPCTRIDIQRHRRENLERIRAYDNSRAMNPGRVEARRQYAASDAGREAHKRALTTQRLRHPEKAVARWMLGNAVRDRRIEKPDKCERCCITSNVIHGHHEDYSKPLDVMWLCTACHAARHREIKAG